ncbi:MAG: glycosyltransferase family 4 protein [Actinomycetota bacterium]|nr:glycosyltransferase family 4 protein [Actinomycetota bacterium]
MRLLFVPTFVEEDVPGLTEAASDAVGYGATSSPAIAAALERAGHDVVVATAPPGTSRTEWIPAVLAAVDAAATRERPDAVLVFSSFTPFAADVRRTLDEHGLDVPLVAWTHGSHWDPTDLYRLDRHRHLRWADLGNLLAADRVLAPSEYMRDTILANVAAAAPVAAAELEQRMRVVGLALDASRLERTRRPRAPGPPTVVFNHALIPAKRPEVFLRALPDLFEAADCRVVLTRADERSERYGSLLRGLRERFPARLELAAHLRLDDYYALLWQASVQVSTASHEGFGVATLEAMATENFCCVPHTGAYPELLGDVSEALFDADEELAGKLATAVLDERLRDETASALADRAARFSPDAIAGDVAAVIREVA